MFGIRNSRQIIGSLTLFCTFIFIGESQTSTKIFDMTADYKAFRFVQGNFRISMIDEFCKPFNA